MLTADTDLVFPGRRKCKIIILSAGLTADMVHGGLLKPVTYHQGGFSLAKLSQAQRSILCFCTKICTTVINSILLSSRRESDVTGRTLLYRKGILRCPCYRAGV